MEQRLKTCVHVPPIVREKHFPVTVKRASATETSTELATKRVKSQSSLLGFIDRPLTKDEQKQLDELYGDACVSCNIAFSAADDVRMKRLLKFPRPSFLLTVRDESGTESFTLGSAIDITGVNYDGEYVMKETLQTDDSGEERMYGVRYGTNLALVPSELKVVLDDDDFWAGVKEISAVLKPLVEAQEETESNNCTIADMAAAIRNICLSFSHLRDRNIS
ncbi:hypothetical protein RvY_18621 [Ramazzottius varieornatus]|uniref:Uncharacterized protein n=1 Tax=Ramazzottius varieornatus TaxID=947166 RepID=A0A1D1W6F9_RAMVA|nr:hypothetical protein RvY_18621 [Ramazzottius varieornatus]